MNTSKFHIFSQGIAASDKGIGSPLLSITPIELVPYYDGGIVDKISIKEHKGVDAAGKAYSVPVKTNNTINATWFNIGGTNRSTPPDVVKGERVFIYQYADEDLYYWDSNGQDDGKRQNETVVWHYANLKDRTKTTNDLTNAYEVKVSTHDKIISIKTNKSDGEPFAYEISLDTKVGKFLVKDDTGNEIMLDSKPKHIRLKNKDGSLLELIGKILNMAASTSVNVTTKDFNVNATTATINAKVQINGGSVKHNSKNIGDTHFHLLAPPKTTPPQP